VNVLIACEYSGVVREAFNKLGHNAWSCDLLPSDIPGNHLQGDVLGFLEGMDEDWDVMIAHPPCTHLAVSGARHFWRKEKEQLAALKFVEALFDAPIPRICLENPVGVISTLIRKPNQIIQPWQFGEPFQKTTCLWLKNLPKLIPTKIVSKGEFVVTPSGKKLPKWYSDNKSGKVRSKTFQGIADAMAAQWGAIEGGEEYV
jgi:site-specific DNA-cytosine methylase